MVDVPLVPLAPGALDVLVRGEPGPTGLLGPLPDLVLGDPLHRHVQPTTGLEGPPERGQDDRIVLRRDHLKRVHAHDAVELGPVGQGLDLSKLRGNPRKLLPGAGEMPRRVVHADQRAPRVDNHPEVLAGAAGRVEHPATDRQRCQETLHEGAVGVFDVPPPVVVHLREGILSPAGRSPGECVGASPPGPRSPRQRRRTRTAPATRSSSPASRVTEIGTRSRPNSPTESMTRLVRSCAVIRTAKVSNEPIRGGANVSTARTPTPSSPAGSQIQGDCRAATATPASDRLTRSVKMVIPTSPTIAARVVAARAPDLRPIMASIVDWRTAPIPARRTATAVSGTSDIRR